MNRPHYQQIADAEYAERKARRLAGQRTAQRFAELASQEELDAAEIHPAARVLSYVIVFVTFAVVAMTVVNVAAKVTEANWACPTERC